VDCVEEVLVASVIAFDVNETLLDLGALDAPFAALLGSAALRPQWFQLMLQLAFTGGLTGRYGDFTAAQRPRWPCWPSVRACRWAPATSTPRWGG
jgi:hypothetical protein